MKALVLHRPGTLAVVDVGTPSPLADEVLVRVTHTGVCGTDLKIFSGAMPARYPIVMGHEVAGEIVDEMGSGVIFGGQSLDGDSTPALSSKNDSRPHLRVLIDPVLYCGRCRDCAAGRTNLCQHGGIIGRDVNGGFAEYVVAPRSHVYPLPDALDSRDAPLLQVLTTCLHAQRRASVGPGHTVAVLGLGVSGQLHVQLAKARGAGRVIGVTRSEWKRVLAADLGADVTTPSGVEAVHSVRAATDGLGADVVIESTGHVPSLADAIAMVRPGGTIVLFGIFTAREAALPFYDLYYKEPTIVSARAATSDDFPESIDLAARGLVRLAPLVTQVLPLAALRDALTLVEQDVDGRMKIVLEH